MPEMPTSEVPAEVAMRALPLQRPGRDHWPALARRLAERHRHQRLRRWALAAAAVLALMVWLPRPGEPDPTSPVSAPRSSAPSPDLARLKQSSAHLESVLALLQVQDEGDAAGQFLRDRLQEEIAGIDALLGSSQTSPEIEAWLWQERVLRLQRLAGLDARTRVLAVQDSEPSTPPTVF